MKEAEIAIWKLDEINFRSEGSLDYVLWRTSEMSVKKVFLKITQNFQLFGNLKTLLNNS